uniref:Uncharacterized protein n=1 Tax=Acrobeloides nanus TaxID=290746 RepID=A0A914C3G3_9BILA
MEKLYKTTIEPMISYSLESWYPSQITLQNKIERVKKFAAKLVTNNFTTAYKTLLEKLNWKPLSQLAMEKRLQLAHHHVHGARSIPDGAFALRTFRTSSRLGHQWQLQVPLAQNTSIAESPVNTIRKLWNELPGDLAAIKNFPEFKRNLAAALSTKL